MTSSSPRRGDETLMLRTLGSAAVISATSGEQRLGPGKPFALLVYLALAPGRRVSRTALIDLLWSDTDEERARNVLRQAIFQLRRVLGEDALVGTEELTLGHVIETDRDRFLEALNRNDLPRAIELYGGAFLPSFGVPGGVGFEHWADLERDRLEAGFVRGAELQVRRLLNQASTNEAKLLARQVRDLVRDEGPHVEAASRLVLEAATASRDFVMAAMEANAIEQRASRDGVVLEPATRTAVARARRAEPVHDRERESSTLVADLTGREKEFHAITSAWDAVRIGPARHLHLSAAAGLGKTRLLHDAVARLESVGARVVVLRGKSGDRDLPYAFVGDLIAAVARMPGAAGLAPASTAALLALNPALSSTLSGAPDLASGDEALRRRVLAVVDLVHAVADEQRFVLAIDDLHWIDALSMRVLEGLWARMGQAHVLCLSASRPERAPNDEHCTVLPLSALSESQVGALVSALGRLPVDTAWTGDFVPGLFAATSGSPLLVLETLRHALDQRVLSLEHSEWHCDDASRLASLLRAGEALRERLRALPPSQLSLLARLSIAGTALDDAALSAIANVSRDDFAAGVEPLEQQGLIVRTSGGLLPAHDEIAAAALDALSDAERVDAERDVGMHFASPGAADANALLRAVRHLILARDDTAVRQLYRRYLQRLRERGDRRSDAALAAEFVGEPLSSRRVHQLVRELPFTWRIGLWSAARRAVVALLVVLLPLFAYGITQARVAHEANGQRLLLADSARAISAVSLQPESWENKTEPLSARAATSVVTAATLSVAEEVLAVSPDGRSLAWTQDSGDSTTLDIWLRTPSGTRRLTRQVRDDVVSGWLPDGSALVGLTDRWSEKGSLGYDIAVFDTATGAARQVTHGSAHDGRPYVSPDGTRIAFVRESDEFPPRVCVVAIDGHDEPDCRLINGHAVIRASGWLGLDELLTVIDAGEAHQLIAYDWARNQTRELFAANASDAELSPDRRWVVARLRMNGVRDTRDWIAPADHPAQARALAKSDSRTKRWWEGAPDRSQVIQRIEFADTLRAIPLGLGTRLRVRSLTAANAEVPLRVAAQWHSSDTLVATVDSLGEVRPRTSGVVTITASLVGAFTVQKQIRVAGSAPVTVLDERWDDRWPTRWIAWGDPMPQVVLGPNNVRGFWNHGDGVFPSMGVLRAGLSAQHGLGVEVRVSTPVTGAKWQHLRLYLVTGIDTTALRRADPQTSPPTARPFDAGCIFDFPRPGRWGLRHATASANTARDIDLGDASIPLRTGAWWTLRVQILPDGRCGFAINNKVLWVSHEPIQLNGEFRVRLGDESADTRILHGPLQVWTGVRTDIDWTAR